MPTCEGGEAVAEEGQSRAVAALAPAQAGGGGAGAGGQHRVQSRVGKERLRRLQLRQPAAVAPLRARWRACKRQPGISAVMRYRLKRGCRALTSQPSSG